MVRPWAVPYDFKGACAAAPDACLGVPYFNWGPSYLDTAQAVVDDAFVSEWQWVGPDWDDIDNADTSHVGWVSGDGLSADAQADLDDFIAGLGSGDVNLYVGPLNWQDGTAFLADGEEASDFQIWYAEQLLEGIVGASAAG